MRRPYKFIYIANYILALTAIGSLLLARALNIEDPEVLDWVNRALIFFPGLAVLNLWSTAFVVTDRYKGPLCLNRRITMCLTGLLCVPTAFAMAVEYYSDDFIPLTLITTGIFVVVLVVCLFKTPLVMSIREYYESDDYD